MNIFDLFNIFSKTHIGPFPHMSQMHHFQYIGPYSLSLPELCPTPIAHLLPLFNKGDFWGADVAHVFYGDSECVLGVLSIFIVNMGLKYLHHQMVNLAHHISPPSQSSSIFSVPLQPHLNNDWILVLMYFIQSQADND